MNMQTFSTQPLNLLLTTPEPNFEEVVDTIFDALRAGALIENTLQDGFQITDIFDGIKLQPIVEEVINDIPVFLSQLTRLTPETAQKSIDEARKRLIAIVTPGKVVSFIVTIIELAARGYHLALTTKQEAEEYYRSWTSLLGIK